MWSELGCSPLECSTHDQMVFHEELAFSQGNQMEEMAADYLNLKSG